MEKEDVKEVLHDLMDSLLGLELDEMKPGDDLRIDIGLDDLDFVELACGLEEKLGIEVAEDWESGVNTVEQLIAVVEKMVE
jgi:acyl carrier protein